MAFCAVCGAHSLTFINEAADFNTRFVQKKAEVRRKVIRTYFICLNKITRAVFINETQSNDGSPDLVCHKL